MRCSQPEIMPDFIILKIIPSNPVLASAFTRLLQGVRITLYDLSIAHSVHGVEIGSASGLSVLGEPLQVTNEPPTLSPAIIQSYASSTDNVSVLKSVATAVVLLSP